jgi:glyoxylase-like metal-dependent hydrolase (beta-lactamase superfamily II)
MATHSVTTGDDGPRISPFTADPVQALVSLDRLLDVQAGLVLPGHGQPWSGGVAAAVSAVRAAAVSTTVGRQAASVGR